jgi:hypothetical protein
MSAHELPYQLNEAPFEASDPGSGKAIPVDRWNLHIALSIAGTETNTLAAPTKAGQRVNLFAAVVSSGSRVVTAASAVNAAGNTKITFDAVDEFVSLESFPVGSGAFEWRVVSYAGASFS